MATDKNKTTDESKDEKTAGTKPGEDTQTSTNERESAPATKVEEAGKVDVDGAASGEVAGGVPRGETGLDFEGDDLDFEAEPADGAFASNGTVQEVDYKGEAYDVPWTYLTVDQVQEEKVRTSDADDADVRSWNVQTTEDDDETPVALVPVEAVPGQTFSVSELPNIDVMEKAGIDAGQFLSGLPVRGDLDDGAPRKGIPA